MRTHFGIVVLSVLPALCSCSGGGDKPAIDAGRVVDASAITDAQAALDALVVDASAPDATTGDASIGDGGALCPDSTGEFLLSVAPSIAPTALLQFIATVAIDSSSAPNAIAMTLQPLCTQAQQCSLGQPVGSPYVLAGSTITAQCYFAMNITAMSIPGGANTISGSPFIANLSMAGDLQFPEFYCGTMDGTVSVGGTQVVIDGSTFAAIGIAPGTLGSNLPTPVATCP